jgi:hypothetical protein
MLIGRAGAHDRREMATLIVDAAKQISRRLFILEPRTSRRVLR